MHTFDSKFRYMITIIIVAQNDPIHHQAGIQSWMVEDDKADEKADRVVQEVTKLLLDLGVLRKHIDDILEKSHTNVSSAVLHAFILVH